MSNLLTPHLNHLMGWAKNITYSILLIGSLSIYLEGTYIERFSTIDNGGIAFTGNSIGLGKSLNENNPGINDSIGAFMTTNPNLQVNHYPPGTTLNISENGSAAVLDLPKGSDVLYAELIWSGSYGWPLDEPLPPPPTDCQVTLTTPHKISHTLKADPLTAQDDLTPGFSKSGNYVRSANVTSIVQLGGRGTYITSQIPGTVDKMDEEHNAAGWTLAVVYHNPNMYTNKMILWVGCEQGKENKSFHVVEDFCTPPSGIKTARLFISAIEGDAVRKGDHLLFGSHSNLIFPEDALFGINNPIDNFFASQINTLINMSKDQNEKLIQKGDALLDTRGTFGLQNQDALHNHNVVGARQGYDITSIDISEKVSYNQTTAYIQGQTLDGDEDYTIGGLGLQVQVDAPILYATKRVVDNDEEVLLTPVAGQSLTFTLVIENTGTLKAKEVFIHNLLQTGLNFVSGSLKVNGIAKQDKDVHLLPIGDMEINKSVIVEYQAFVDSSFLKGKPKIKPTMINYLYQPNHQALSIILTASTNPLTFTEN